MSDGLLLWREEVAAVSRELAAVGTRLGALGERASRALYGLAVLAALARADLPVRPGRSVASLGPAIAGLPTAYRFRIVSARPVAPVTLARPSELFAPVPALEFQLDGPLPGRLFLPVEVEFLYDAHARGRVETPLAIVPAP